MPGFRDALSIQEIVEAILKRSKGDFRNATDTACGGLRKTYWTLSPHFTGVTYSVDLTKMYFGIRAIERETPPDM